MKTNIHIQALLSRNVLPEHQEAQLVYVLVIATPEGATGRRERLPLNLCLVLDRSSSMRGERLTQVKEAAKLIVNELQPTDYFSLVTFNDRATIVIPAQKMQNPDLLRYLIDDVESAGGTEMAYGMEMAHHEMKRTKLLHGMNHVIVLTDGRTYGDEGKCLQYAKAFDEQKISLTAIGIGDQWNEDLLDMMTSTENSHTRYIMYANDIVAVFTEELTRIYSMFAQGVQLLVESRQDSLVRSIDRIQPYIAPVNIKSERDLRWVANLGNWHSTDVQMFLLEVVVPPLTAGNYPLLNIVLRYGLPGSDKRDQKCMNKVAIHIDTDSAQHTQIDSQIKYWLERLTAYRLQSRAWLNVQDGNIGEAINQLNMAGTRLLNAGEASLAQTVHLEASRLHDAGKPSAEGRKRIIFGTRGLFKPPL